MDGDVCTLRRRFTFGRAGRSARKDEICQGVFTHVFHIIICRFLDGSNEIIERPVPFHLSFENENPVRLRETSFLGDDPGILKIPRARKDLSDLGDLD